ncbi:MAG TPA: hypothetical protein VI432_00095 [Candidatus Paceibacterota bacterium]
MTKRESTYTVEWIRSILPDEINTCSGLTARVAFARLIQALNNSGPIIVKKIKIERK